MYEKMEKLLTPPVRLGVALVLFLAGVIWQIASGKTLDMYAFYIMSAAMLCVVNVLICKISKSETNFILYLVINLAVLIVGFALTESENITGVVLYGAWGICGAVDWVINAVLVRCEDILKRIVMGFVASVLNILFIAVVFIVPILLAVFI